MSISVAGVYQLLDKTDGILLRMGIDGGGVFKEFLTDLSKEVFDSDRGLWLANKKNELYPNHGSYATQRKHFPNAVLFTK